ncbi:MAG TPA: D-alanyl-D-alanine endopeptidase [Steroidobacteraceae bacterium]|nr:D-alanyl-D-alanine endopeptidase [Steroidobacteraceae bacterium]
MSTDETGAPAAGIDTLARPADPGQTPAHHRASHRARTGLAGPVLRSGSALIIDESTSAVLFARHADLATPIASITKLMTALVVLEANQPLNEELEISSDDQRLGKTNVSRLAVGTRLSRGDLLHLALMSSENRAANALGRNYPGGLPACVAAMNAKARALGMTSARFVEPTGLSSDNVASPEDLSKLVIAASQSPTIQSYSTDSRYLVAIGRQVMEFRNTDSLVSSPSWNIVVQKTGYIAEAGRCLVMKAMIEGRAIVIVLLDSVGKRTRFADARRIKRYLESRLTADALRAAAAKA